MAGRDVEPGKPHWRKSDLPLMDHTQAPKTEVMYTLQICLIHQTMRKLHIKAKSLNTFTRNGGAQVVDIREDAAAEAEKADKGDDGKVNKDDSKQAKLKPK